MSFVPDYTGSTTTVSSGFGSFADLAHSQAELYPSSFSRKKDVENNDEKSENKSEKETKEYIGIKRYGGMIMTVGASIAFSFVTLIVKKLQDYGTDAYGASFWRYTSFN